MMIMPPSRSNLSTLPLFTINFFSSLVKWSFVEKISVEKEGKDSFSVANFSNFYPKKSNFCP